MDRGVAAMMTLSNKLNRAFESDVENFLSHDEYTKENFEATRASLDKVFTVLHDEGLLKNYK